jgi:hypothetical protein
MANEKRLSLSLSVVKDGLTAQLVKSVTGDLTGDQMTSTAQLIGNAWEAITFTDLASVEIFALCNLDATNSIDVAVANDNTGIFATLAAGGGPKSVTYVPAKAAVTYYAKSSAGTPALQVVAAEP